MEEIGIFEKSVFYAIEYEVGVSGRRWKGDGGGE